MISKIPADVPLGRSGSPLMAADPHHFGPQSTVHAIFGIVALLGALLMFWGLCGALRLRRRGVHVLGTVIDHVAIDRVDANDEGFDRAKVAFTDGQGHRFTVTLKTSNKFVPVGERLPLVHLPDRPYDARPESETSRWVVSIMLAGALLFLALGIALLTGPPPPPPGYRPPEFLSDLPWPLFLSLVPITAGFGILALMFFRFRRLAALQRNGIRTTGTVTRSYTSDDGLEVSFFGYRIEKMVGKVRVISFSDSRNRHIQFTSRRGPRSVGATMPVAYLRDDPTIAEVAPPLRTITSLVFPTLISLVFAALGVGTLASFIGHYG
ncbi:DUF3592 domain-containing protein [Actinomadura adrarensis]|uniref:DUF3592 domain-containing protein n=1 Tax=Actinomadura adrarensis TaxID=1819600 RepID=A0ABW3CV16_9ACTN